MRFNWLHITDLHHGMSGQGWLLPGVKHRFFDDLKYLHPKCGPWDLILFTGDLSQKGTSKEFTAVDELLAELLVKLRELQPGHDPVLLAVPGNHDLTRPADTDEALALVESWENGPRNRKRLWEGKDLRLHETVNKAFKAYGDWW